MLSAQELVFHWGVTEARFPLELNLHVIIDCLKKIWMPMAQLKLEAVH